MNYSYRKNNERILFKGDILLKTKHKFKKKSMFSQSQDTTRDPLYHNYILRIYLKNDNIITPTL